MSAQCGTHMERAKSRSASPYMRLALAAVAALGTLILYATGVSVLASTAALLCIGLWCARSDMPCLQFTAMALLWTLAFVYLAHGSLSSSSFWILRIYPTTDGKSSCSKDELSTMPFNPNGWLGDATMIHATHTFCHYPNTRWADATGVAPEPTSAALVLSDSYTPCTSDCVMASRMPQAYLNLGRGLSHGWFYGASVSDTTLCMGVRRQVNAIGIMGKGEPICSQCTSSFVNKGRIPVQPQCAVTESDLACKLCPGYYDFESGDPYAIRALACWILVLAIVVTLFSIVDRVGGALTHATKTRKGHSIGRGEFWC